MTEIKKILLSRTDAIGDLILTLPMVDVIKQNFPAAKVFILGRNYNKPIAQAAVLVDGFIDWSELENQTEKNIVEEIKKQNFDVIVNVFPNKKIATVSKKAGIPIRIGTSRRFFHWINCNYLVNLSRKNSDLHEAQLNIKLLQKLNIPTDFSLETLKNFGRIKPFAQLPNEINLLLNKNEKPKIILHPKSKGSAKNWCITNFVKLADMLLENNFDVFFTGTAEESNLIKTELSEHFPTVKLPTVIDLMGKLNLSELITFISKCDFLVAASTGPLHIGAALGINVIGIYPPIRPMHPARWQPLGINANFLCVDKECSKCRNSSICYCMQEITPEHILKIILE